MVTTTRVLVCVITFLVTVGPTCTFAQTGKPTQSAPSPVSRTITAYMYVGTGTCLTSRQHHIVYAYRPPRSGQTRISQRQCQVMCTSRPSCNGYSYRVRTPSMGTYASLSYCRLSGWSQTALRVNPPQGFRTYCAPDTSKPYSLSINCCRGPHCIIASSSSTPTQIECYRKLCSAVCYSNTSPRTCYYRYNCKPGLQAASSLTQEATFGWYYEEVTSSSRCASSRLCSNCHSGCARQAATSTTSTALPTMISTAEPTTTTGASSTAFPTSTGRPATPSQTAKPQSSSNRCRTSPDNRIRCKDGHVCAAGQWNCCARHGGRRLCPTSHPAMCAQMTCGGTDYCCESFSRCLSSSYGGLRRDCPSAPTNTTSPHNNATDKGEKHCPVILLSNSLCFDGYYSAVNPFTWRKIDKSDGNPTFIVLQSENGLVFWTIGKGTQHTKGFCEHLSHYYLSAERVYPVVWPTGQSSWLAHRIHISGSRVHRWPTHRRLLNVTCYSTAPSESRITTGYRGARSTIIEHGLHDITHSHNMFAVMVNCVLFGAAMVLTIMSLLRSHAKASHSSISMLAFGVSDVFTDTLLLINIYPWLEYRELFTWFLVCQLLSLVTNGILLGYIFHREFKETRFLYWHLTNANGFNTIITMACFDMQIVQLLYSQVFDIELTNAFITPETRSRLNMASSISFFVENVPQLYVEILIYHHMKQSNDSLIVLMTIFFSVFDILQSFVGLVTWFMINQAHSSLRKSVSLKVQSSLEDQYWTNNFQGTPRRKLLEWESQASRSGEAKTSLSRRSDDSHDSHQSKRLDSRTSGDSSFELGTLNETASKIGSRVRFVKSGHKHYGKVGTISALNATGSYTIKLQDGAAIRTKEKYIEPYENDEISATEFTDVLYVNDAMSSRLQTSSSN